MAPLPNIGNKITAGAGAIGKTIGDSVEVATPGGGKSYEIIKIKYA